jgi:hypothetical protein
VNYWELAFRADGVHVGVGPDELVVTHCLVRKSTGLLDAPSAAMSRSTDSLSASRVL